MRRYILIFMFIILMISLSFSGDHNLHRVLSAKKGLKVYVTDYDYQADLKIFVCDYDYQADLKVYKTNYDYQATDYGLWYFVKYDYQADKKIYFTDYDYQADIKISFVDYSYRAGWNNRSKMDLLY